MACLAADRNAFGAAEAAGFYVIRALDSTARIVEFGGVPAGDLLTGPGRAPGAPVAGWTQRGAILRVMRFFNRMGPVEREEHYCIPPLERVDLEEILTLVRQRAYFVLHAPRQTGKTSTLLAAPRPAELGVRGGLPLRVCGASTSAGLPARTAGGRRVNSCPYCGARPATPSATNLWTEWWPRRCGSLLRTMP